MSGLVLPDWADNQVIREHFLLEFQKEFASKFEEIKKVLRWDNPDRLALREITEEHTKLAIMALVHRYRRRRDPAEFKRRKENVAAMAAAMRLEVLAAENYSDAVVETKSALTTAEKALSKVMSGIGGFLDHEHSSVFFTALGQFDGDGARPSIDLMQVMEQLSRTRDLCSCMRVALTISTGEMDKPRSKGFIPHIPEIQDIAELWQQLTGTELLRQPKEPKNPKRAKGKTRKATQRPTASHPHTEFARLLLKMIDPTLTVENTVTLIRKRPDTLTEMTTASKLFSRYIGMGGKFRPTMDFATLIKAASELSAKEELEAIKAPANQGFGEGGSG